MDRNRKLDGRHLMGVHSTIIKILDFKNYYKGTPDRVSNKNQDKLAKRVYSYFTEAVPLLDLAHQIT